MGEDFWNLFLFLFAVKRKMLLMFLLLLKLLYMTDGADTSPAETVCTVNTCFTFHVERKTFDEAQMHCKVNGGNLVVLKYRDESANLYLPLSRMESKEHKSLKFWIGLKLHKGSCVSRNNFKGFKWILGGESTDYANWEKEPHSTCSEDRCVAVHAPLAEDDLRWMDRSCKDKEGFVCKFEFKGMCKALEVPEAGDVAYQMPFLKSPLGDGKELTVLPHGTFASVSCHVGKPNYSMCVNVEGFYRWTVSGPFCGSVKRNCKFQNGGCDHHCFHSGSGDIHCGCKEGYELGQDQVSCVLKDKCKNSPCKFGCESGPEAFVCKCPNGFQIAADNVSCVDVNECDTGVCDQQCVNTEGSFSCFCREGYKLRNGSCEDIDECAQIWCQKGCQNSPGSFSCYCDAGYTLSKNGRTCEDVDECHTNPPCLGKCQNTVGSYECTCKKHFTLAADQVSCVPDAADQINQEVKRDFSTYQPPNASRLSSTSMTDTAYRGSPGFTVGYTIGSPSVAATASESNGRLSNPFPETWTLLCAIGSAVSLLVILMTVLAIVVFRRRRTKKAKKSQLTADSYCWVSDHHKSGGWT